MLELSTDFLPKFRHKDLSKGISFQVASFPTIPDQTAFIRGKKAKDKSIRALHFTHWVFAQKMCMPTLLLSTDVKKAFDKVDWVFLEETLITLGLGPKILV